MPPKKVVKASAKGKKSSARLAAAAASSNTTFPTSTSSAIATTTAANSSSARARYREARGVPDDIGKATNNATQDRFRAKKKVKTTSAWKNANPKEKERMLIAAANAVMKDKPDARAIGAAIGMKMGLRFGKWREMGKGENVEAEGGDEEAEEEDAGAGPDDEPGVKEHRREDEDDDEDDPNGEYTKQYMSRSIPRQVRIKLSPLPGKSAGIQRSELTLDKARLGWRRLLRYPAFLDLDLWCHPAPLCFPWTAAAASVLSCLLLVPSAVVFFAAPLPSGSL
ncbi:hypothetical protein BCIN_09g05830 [Botrytis cinerea B05.10]|uniref:Uncharacterized protein n=1 Tax=Botryotinia fuckeliana (strain B05.10) TaxID=332648 RepID=A0A384JTK4_BOTFB|nr:hypothetical protein BCIN_09g05830 [Botrytis cinerea B05.10]ATZ53811.1 hypothetical protein BCIN_09g05830 [Botrytis cinerea B05.10]